MQILEEYRESIYDEYKALPDSNIYSAYIYIIPIWQTLMLDMEEKKQNKFTVLT